MADPNLDQRINQLKDGITSATTAAAAAQGTASSALQPANFITGEIPTGTIDGTNRVFTLAHVPAAASLVVYPDGMRSPATAYTLVGAVITMTTAPLFTMSCDYRI